MLIVQIDQTTDLDLLAQTLNGLRSPDVTFDPATEADRRRLNRWLALRLGIDESID